MESFLRSSRTSDSPPATACSRCSRTSPLSAEPLPGRRSSRVPTGHAWIGGAILAAISVVGLPTAFTLPHVPVARAEGGLVKTVSIAWGAVRDDRILRLAIIGQVFVWSIAALVPPPIQAYALLTLKLDKGYVGIPLAALGIGIGLGCLAAGKLSASKVEYGLLPLGRWADAHHAGVRGDRAGAGRYDLILMGADRGSPAACCSCR